MSEVHLRANNKKTQSLGKNGCRQKCLDKRSLDQHVWYLPAATKSMILKFKVKNLRKLCNKVYILHVYYDLAEMVVKVTQTEVLKW